MTRVRVANSSDIVLLQNNGDDVSANQLREMSLAEYILQHTGVRAEGVQRPFSETALL